MNIFIIKNCTKTCFLIIVIVSKVVFINQSFRYWRLCIRKASASGLEEYRETVTRELLRRGGSAGTCRGIANWGGGWIIFSIRGGGGGGCSSGWISGRGRSAAGTKTGALGFNWCGNFGFRGLNLSVKSTERIWQSLQKNLSWDSIFSQSSVLKQVFNAERPIKSGGQRQFLKRDKNNIIMREIKWTKRS